MKSAATRAKLGGDYRVVYIERETSKVDRLIDLFGGSVAQAVGAQVKLGLAGTGLPSGVAGEAARELSWLNELGASRKPFMALTHCLCEAP